jgi:hypothetical protein
MIVKLAANAFTKNWHNLSSLAKKDIGQSGAIRSRSQYLIGMIKGNENIKNQLEKQTAKKISYVPSKLPFQHYSHPDKQHTIGIADSTKFDGSKSVFRNNKDIKMYEALLHRHELREGLAVERNIKNNIYNKENIHRYGRGIFLDRDRNIVADHASVTLPLDDIIDARKIPYKPGITRLRQRSASGELGSLQNTLVKSWQNFNHNDKSKLIKIEKAEPYRALTWRV